MTTPYQEIDKEDIQKLSLYRYSGKISVIDQQQQIDKAIREISREKLIGLDTERKPSFKKGKINSIALIQIATPQQVFLFRMNMLKQPEKVFPIFENPDILKVGVGLDDDIQGLKKLKPFHPQGFIDISKYFQSHNYKQSSLKYLAAIVLNMRISKSQQVSNWEREQLTSSQLKYAATDAWIPREIYLSMIQDGNYPEIMTE
ncbi:MAG: 3'-5' exonuclease [Bacteroidales bacterium]